MSLQSIKAKLLAVGLFALSTGGTMALFGCVPVIARMLSPDQPSMPPQTQAFPQQSPEWKGSLRSPDATEQ